MTTKAWRCVALALIASLTLVTEASAAGRATSRVSIVPEQGGFFGVVSSSKPSDCAENRRVTLFRQLGSKQDPKTDERIASTRTFRAGDKFIWSLGHIGTGTGKFYARVGKNSKCKADTSPTVNGIPDDLAEITAP